MIELTDFYIPKEIPHREKQIEELKDIINNFKKYNSGTNLIIFGVTGSGKTTIVKKVLEQNNCIYVSGVESDTAFKTLKSFFNLKIQTHEELLRRTIERLQQEPKIIIIDEVDKITDTKRLFNDLNTIYRKTMIPIILVTIKHNLISEMPIDAKKTLYFDKMSLPAYNSLELKDILISRINQVKDFIPEGLDEGTINYISAIAGRQGSARALIQILVRCIQRQNFNHEFIEEVYRQMLEEECFDYLENINDTEREFLRYLIDSCTDEEETTSEILEKKIGLSNARVSQLLNIFEKYSLIKTYHRNLGRGGGRKRMIKFISKDIYEELKKRF